MNLLIIFVTIAIAVMFVWVVEVDSKNWDRYDD